MSRLDLRDRVTLATALVLAAGLAVLTVGGHLLLSHQLKNDVTARLRERADAQLALVNVLNGRVVVHDAADDGALDAYVARVRRKLREAGAPEAVETVRGVGYSLR